MPEAEVAATAPIASNRTVVVVGDKRPLRVANSRPKVRALGARQTILPWGEYKVRRSLLSGDADGKASKVASKQDIEEAIQLPSKGVTKALSKVVAIAV